MYNLERFTYREMMQCRGTIRELFGAAEMPSLAAGAERVVDFFYENLADAKGNRACALVRMFKTHPFEALDDELRSFASSIVPDAYRIPGLRCLVLVATRGEEPAWNSCHESRGHRCIPLASEKMVEEAPMISQLIKQIGLKISDVVHPDPGLMLDQHKVNYNVFYVPTAEGSPFIVAQDFVKRYGIASVIGFGGVAGASDLVATILFSRVPISADVADLFRVIGLNVRIAVLPLITKPLFV
ncbi:MAG TPA: hypothetical protein VLU46_16350 [Thermoanaerobaculia bacterium]|nr:hypothetical protein [Thermoanaerobaculia bacterium]